MTGLTPPIDVALARPAAHLPLDAIFEPKYDGWRAILFATGYLHSRRGTPLGARFPELRAIADVLDDAVLDGEIVAFRVHEQRLDFGALQYGPERRHAEGIQVHLMAFDLLGVGGQDLRKRPLRERREALTTVIPSAQPQIQLVPATTDRDTAPTWLDPAWGDVGIEGVIAKPAESHYLPGYRSGWLKIRTRTTTEAVVLGVVGADSLILGRPDSTDRWRVIGLSQPIPERLRAELAALLHPDPQRPEPVQLPGVAVGLPGGDPVRCTAVRPEVIVEIEADTAIEFGRQRHRPRILRRRPDLQPDDLAEPDHWLR